MSATANINDFVDANERGIYTEEQLARGIRQYCEATGKSFIVLESAWWGNEKFRVWERQFLANVERVSHDDETGEVTALLLQNVETLQNIRGAIRQRERVIAEIMEDNVRTEGESYFTDTLNESRALLNGEIPMVGNEVDSAWVPASKVTFRADFEGPQSFLRFDGSEWERVSRDDADAVIEKTIPQHTKWGVYDKLAINIREYIEDTKDKFDDYMGGESWAQYHFTGHEHRGQFYWVADPEDPEGFAMDLAKALGISVAVHEDLWGDDATPV